MDHPCCAVLSAAARSQEATLQYRRLLGHCDGSRPEDDWMDQRLQQGAGQYK